jgi:myo-inositol-1(or 4)-monophosphatase
MAYHELHVHDIPVSMLESVAVSAILRASDLVKEGFYSALSIQEKSGPHDIVTQFDKAAERAIIDTIRNTFPNHAFIGEEGGIQGVSSNTVTWIIDPIDGTWNFARQIPSFGCSIAVMYNQVVYVGAVIDPIANELFVAKKGYGSTMNGKKLSVSQTANLKGSGVSLRVEMLKKLPHNDIGVLRRSGSTVLDMCYVAKGSLEGFIERGINIWDFAASTLIVQEAGGTVTNLDKTQTLLDPTRKHSIIATNGLIHKELLTWISMEHS